MSESNILNLSSYALSDAESSLLEMGLTFVPSPKIVPKSSLLSAASNYKRLIKLRYFFRNHPSVKSKTKYVGKSNFTPSDSLMPPHIKAFSYAVDKFSSNFKSKAIKSNLPAIEQQAIKSLRDNESIIIKKADKSGTTVVMNREDYITQSLAHLLDASTLNALMKIFA